jgi:hypothetical protein
MTPEDVLEYSFERILSEIQTNTFIRSVFRKDYSRQCIHEKTQIDWIKLKLLPDILKLNSGVGGIYFNNFKLSSERRRPTNASKTLDVFSPSKNIYGVLKYTTNIGGAQDNQFNDVKFFM